MEGYLITLLLDLYFVMISWFDTTPISESPLGKLGNRSVVIGYVLTWGCVT